MLRKIYDNLEEIITVPLMASLLAVLTWQISSRWILNSPSLWSEELASVLFMHMALIGCAIAVKRDSHVKITFFADKLPELPRFVLMFTLEIAVLVSMFAMIYLATSTFSVQPFFELITLGISSKWMNYSLVIGGCFMVLRQTERMWYLLNAYRTGTLPKPEFEEQQALAGERS